METIIYIILTIVLIIILVILSKYNQMIRSLNKVKKSSANIEIYLKKRFDLIPNLVECVKGYSKHEKDTLENIISLRNSYDNHQKLNIEEATEMNNQLNKYLAIVENYPDLKANSDYMNLQKELREIEDQLQRARSIYNEEATNYNTATLLVPSNIIAIIFDFKKVELFKIESKKRENVKIAINK